MARQLGLLADAPFPPGETPVRPGPARRAGLAERRVPVGVIGANFEARPERGRGRRLPAAEVAQRRGAAHRGSGAAVGGGAVRPGDRARRWRPPGSTRARCSSSASAGPGGRRRAGPPAGADPAGDPARQRRDHPRAGRGGGPARRAHAGPRRRRRRALPGRRRRPGAGRRDHRRQPRPARRLQPAQPAAGRTRPPGTRCCRWRWRRCRPLGVAASLPPHDHPLGHEWALDERARGHRDGRPGRGPGRRPRGSPTTQTSGLAAGIVTADAAAARAFLAAYPAPARSGTPAPGCSTGSSCAACRRPASTSTTCPARAAR